MSRRRSEWCAPCSSARTTSRPSATPTASTCSKTRSTGRPSWPRAARTPTSSRANGVYTRMGKHQATIEGRGRGSAAVCGASERAEGHRQEAAGAAAPNRRGGQDAERCPGGPRNCAVRMHAGPSRVVGGWITKTQASINHAITSHASSLAELAPGRSRSAASVLQCTISTRLLVSIASEHADGKSRGPMSI